MIRESWNNYGSYDISHPALENGRIIVLNTTFLSARYQNSCGESAEDPGQGMLKWLEGRLSDAASHRRRVWLVYHIPPGIDGYATTHPKGSNAESVVTMWRPPYEIAFEKLLSRYAGTVQNQFAGHSHFDDFRLLGKPGAYSSFVLLSPGLSPNVRQNPAFREVTFRPDGRMVDQSTYYLANLQESAQGSAPEWKQEYSFRHAWGSNAVDLANLVQLYSRLQDVPAVRELWKTFYSVSNGAGENMTPKAFFAVACATGNVLPEDYRTCFCRQIPGAAFCRN